MNIDKETPDDSKNSATKEQEKKMWSQPKAREFVIGEVTNNGTHCAGDGTFSS